MKKTVHFARKAHPRPGQSVPLLDLRAQYVPLRADIEKAIRNVCDSQQFILGPAVRELEERIAAYSNCAFGIGVSSGTDALLAALMALEVGAGDEVITTSYSFFATAGVIARLRATPVFCDILPDTWNIDPEAVGRYLDEHCHRVGGKLANRATGAPVKAIMPVHLFGQLAGMGRLTRLADDFGLAVVEDAAQAIGAEDAQGRRAGSSGSIGCFSFFPSKNLGAFGDAGMCVTQSEALAERLRILRQHGAGSRHHYPFVGGNFRLDTLQAAVLNVKLDYLDTWTNTRQSHAARYSRAINDLAIPVKTPVVQPGYRHTFNQYVIKTERRDALRAFLQERHVGTEVYYPVPLHRQTCFQHIESRVGTCPVAESAASRTLALPVYPELTTEQQDYVLGCLAEFFGVSTA